MNVIKKEQLTGFRTPRMQEKILMQKRCEKELKGERLAVNVWFVITGILGFMLLLGIVVNIGEETAGIESLLYIVLRGICIVAFLLLFHGRRNNCRLLNLLRKGNFEVLDCRVYESDMMTDIAGKGTVKIYTDQGQYCSEAFLTDFESAKEWSVRKNMKFWLLRCNYGEKDLIYYRLFSENDLAKEAET